MLQRERGYVTAGEGICYTERGCVLQRGRESKGFVTEICVTLSVTIKLKVFKKICIYCL
jgi:hypothetical protein